MTVQLQCIHIQNIQNVGFGTSRYCQGAQCCLAYAETKKTETANGKFMTGAKGVSLAQRPDNLNDTHLRNEATALAVDAVGCITTQQIRLLALHVHSMSGHFRIVEGALPGPMR